MSTQKKSLTATTALVVTLRATIGLTMAAMENRTNAQTAPAILVTGPFLVLLLVAAFGIMKGRKWGVNLGLAASIATGINGALGAYILLTIPGSFVAGPLMGLIMSIFILGWLLFSGVRRAVF